MSASDASGPCTRITWIFFLFLKSLRSTEKLTSDEMSITAQGEPALSIKRLILKIIQGEIITFYEFYVVTIGVICHLLRFC